VEPKEPNDFRDGVPVNLHDASRGPRAISLQDAANDAPNFFFGKAQSKQWRVPSFRECMLASIAFKQILSGTWTVFFTESDVSCPNDPMHLTILVGTGELLGFSF